MQLASLGSGSKGNATIIQTGSSILMVDCGFSAKQLALRLKKLALHEKQIDAILVTHEHQDHIKGVARLAKQNQIPVWASWGTIRSGKFTGCDTRFISIHESFHIKDCKITPVPVPHDANEACQFVIEHQMQKIGILTDTGCITNHIVSTFSGCQLILLECNYDEQMLENGPYPQVLRSRIKSNFGHLSNQQAQDFLRKIDQTALKQVILMHLSEQNNAPHLAHDMIAEVINSSTCELMVASQNEGFVWQKLVDNTHKNRTTP